ncbi:hypothetical protein K474DRAFT_1673091 [Panus rudis PR-1116 ss-1]|nr:hypothetical protein K474DRAFT_1673091 [Panus rudis PR-1116 ss-1]
MHVPSLNMSSLIATDAPLLSPTAPPADWDHPQYSPTAFGDLQYPVSPTPSHAMASGTQSPVPPAMMLRGRLSPDYSDSEPQLCVPTHQVFDCPPAAHPAQAPESLAQQQHLLQHTATSRFASNPPSSTVPSKRASSAAASTSKKARAGERVTTKDFVPPDVTGLSKREARLVKNRAAAFLSRQRKREEFENMEIRVAELEQENARLLALANSKQSEPADELLSEVEQLRRQLARAQERERELNEELSRKEAAAQAVKMETVEPDFSAPSRSASMPPQHKSGASLGLMVLLCALPSLLSLPTHSAFPTSFSLPITDASSLPSASSAFDINSLMPGDFDWAFNSAGSIMDLDVDSKGRITHSEVSSTSNSAKKLEFVDVDSEALGLSGLDISFDAMASQDGKIRVRIHPSASSASSPPTSAPSPESHSESEDQSMWGGSEASGPTSSFDGQQGSSSQGSTASTSATGSSSSDLDQLGPFLGVGGCDNGFGSLSHLPGMSIDAPMNGVSSWPGFDTAFDFGSGLSDIFGSGPSSPSAAGRKRVRIALKSLPGEGAEGGEWEVQVC